MPVASCSVHDLPTYVYDEQTRVKLQDTPPVGRIHDLYFDPCSRMCVQLELISLIATNKFCYAGCALPYCRAKVPPLDSAARLVLLHDRVVSQTEHSKVTVRDGVTIYQCNAKRPHRCLTFSWRFMCQAQFKAPELPSQVAPPWLVCLAPELILVL